MKLQSLTVVVKTNKFKFQREFLSREIQTVKFSHSTNFLKLSNMSWKGSNLEFNYLQPIEQL